MLGTIPKDQRATRSRLNVLLILLGSLMAGNTLAGSQICPLVPYATFIMYAYQDMATHAWRGRGWYRTEPGQCVQLPESAGTTYMFAEADPKDIVAQARGEANSTWSGDQNQGGVQVCVPVAEFHRGLEVCDSTDRRIWIDPFQQQTLELISDDTHKQLGFNIESPAQAAYVARNIKGQILFGQSIANDPKGAPYRIGAQLAQDDAGVYVGEVSAGMPADGVLQTGDRVVQIAGEAVYSVRDAVVAIQRFGMTSDPRNRNLEVSFWRWTDLAQPPTRYAGAMPLAYYRNLDPRLSPELAARARRVALIDGALWGFRDVAVCGLLHLSDTPQQVPSHLNHLSCSEREAFGAAMLAEMYPDLTRTFDLIGSGFSPRLVFRSAARRGMGSGARLAFAMADEAVQGGLTVIGQASSSAEVTPPAILKGMALGAGVGAATGILFGN